MAWPRMSSKLYFVQGDAMDAIYAALPQDMIDGKTPFQIGTGCLLQFQDDSDMIAFKFGLRDPCPRRASRARQRPEPRRCGSCADAGGRLVRHTAPQRPRAPATLQIRGQG